MRPEIPFEEQCKMKREAANAVRSARAALVQYQSAVGAGRRSPNEELEQALERTFDLACRAEQYLHLGFADMPATELDAMDREMLEEYERRTSIFNRAQQEGWTKFGASWQDAQGQFWTDLGEKIQ